MPEQMYAVKVSAVGEVRDQDGNLINSEPIEATLTLTADEVRQLTGETP